jgi:hypothetical protein
MAGVLKNPWSLRPEGQLELLGVVVTESSGGGSPLLETMPEWEVNYRQVSFVKYTTRTSARVPVTTSKFKDVFRTICTCLSQSLFIHHWQVASRKYHSTTPTSLNSRCASGRSIFFLKIYSCIELNKNT